MVRSRGALYPSESGREAGKFIEIRFFMPKSYQLVAWTEDGKVRMVPSQIDTYIHEELEQIQSIIDKVRYGTYHEVHDLLQLSSAYEKLALNLLSLGQVSDAFRMLVDAAHCCTASYNNWEDTEWGDLLCRPLRGRFFAMYSLCKELVRKHPKLHFEWEISGLQQTSDHITYPFKVFELEWNGQSSLPPLELHKV